MFHKLVSRQLYDALKKQVDALEAKVESLKPVDDIYDLNEEFTEIIALEDDLVLDEFKPAPTPEVLNKVFKTKANEKDANPKDLVAHTPKDTTFFWKGYVIDPD